MINTKFSTVGTSERRGRGRDWGGVHRWLTELEMWLRWAVDKCWFYYYALYLDIYFQLSSIFYRNEIDGTGGQRILPALSKSPLSLILQNINKMGLLSFFQDCGKRAISIWGSRWKERYQDAAPAHIPTPYRAMAPSLLVLIPPNSAAHRFHQPRNVLLHP